MSLEGRNKPNENTNLVVKNWQNNDTLEEIVKYEYRKLNKTEFVEDDIEILRGQRLKFLGDWKDLTKEQKKIFPVGLSNLLDKVAGIEPENVSSRKNKTTKGGGRRRGTTNKMHEMLQLDKLDYSYYFDNLYYWFFGCPEPVNLESSNGRDQSLYSVQAHGSLELDNINGYKDIDYRSIRKRK